MTIQQLRDAVANEKQRSTYDRGVQGYALEMLDAVICGEYHDQMTKDSPAKTLTAALLLNHVGGCHMFIGMFRCADARQLCLDVSWGGNFEIYDEDIARRLCPPSVLKRTKNGKKTWRKDYPWLDAQAEALHRALMMIQRIARG